MDTRNVGMPEQENQQPTPQESRWKNAESFGLKPESVDNFKQPVLVRQRQGEMDTDQRIAFTKEANARDTASMSPAEKAKLDASRITQEDLSHFDTDDTGDLLHRSNDVFLARFADRLGSEAGELKTRQGDWNKQMRDRVESALFMKAYDDRTPATETSQWMRFWISIPYWIVTVRKPNCSPDGSMPICINQSR